MRLSDLNNGKVNQHLYKISMPHHLLFSMSQSFMKYSVCLAWVWKNMVCLKYYFFQMQICLEKYSIKSAFLGICGPRNKKIALGGIVLPRRERVQGLLVV